MIDLNEFSNEIKACIEKYVTETDKVSINTLWKNNGIRLVGISIMEKSSNITPTFYLEDYYERFKEGENIENLAKEIFLLNQKYRLENPIELDFFLDFEKAKEHIVFKLINRKLNSALLKKVPHVEYMDLAIVFYYLVENETFGNGSILIHDSHVSMWNVKIEDVYKCAFQNAPILLPAMLYEMKTVLYDLATSDKQREYLKKEFEDCNIPMYVLTNDRKMDGAAVLLYKDELNSVAVQLDDSFYVIPSSIHEVLIVPQQFGEMYELNEMVNEVNRTQLDPREILSDHVYFYDSKEMKLISCANER